VKPELRYHLLPSSEFYPAVNFSCSFDTTSRAEANKGAWPFAERSQSTSTKQTMVSYQGYHVHGAPTEYRRISRTGGGLQPLTYAHLERRIGLASHHIQEARSLTMAGMPDEAPPRKRIAVAVSSQTSTDQ
jgi:hypothetical protein